METEEVFRLVEIIDRTFKRRFGYSHLDIDDLKQETFIIGMTTEPDEFLLAWTRSYYVGIKMLRCRYVDDSNCCRLTDMRDKKIKKLSESQLQDFRIDLVTTIATMSNEDLDTIIALSGNEQQNDLSKRIRQSPTMTGKIINRVRTSLAVKLNIWRKEK